MNIYIFDPDFDTKFTHDIVERLKKAGDLFLVKKKGSFNEINKLINDKKEKILAINPDFCDWNVEAKDIKGISNVKAVCLQTTSTQWIDMEYLKNKEIPVINIKNWATDSVAEYFVLSVLMIARKINIINMNKGIEDYGTDVGIELRRKTAGIVGMGDVAGRIAELCKGMGMEVIYWSRKSRDKRYKYSNLKNLFSKADVLFFAVPDVEELNNIITKEILKKLRPTTIVASVYHCLFNENDELRDMVKNNKIFGYSYERGSSKVGKTYKANIWQGPRVAWLTKDSIERNTRMWVENIIKASKGDYSGRVF